MLKGYIILLTLDKDYLISSMYPISINHMGFFNVKSKIIK